MVHGWMRRVSKKLVSGRRKKGRHPPAFLRYIGSRLHAETGCKKVYAGQVIQLTKKSHGVEGDDWG